MSKINYLSKSDFKIAQTCATKLFYKKKNYPNTNQENEFMQSLADGGYLIGKYAQLMYSQGIEVSEKDTDLLVAIKTNVCYNRCVMTYITT